MELQEISPERKFPASHKLALAAIADDASDKTNKSFPGIEKVMQWSGTGQRRALELISDLVDAGFIERVKGGYPGSRAVYLVTLPTPDPVDNSEKMGAESRTHSEMGAENPKKVRDLAPLSLEPLLLTLTSSTETHVTAREATSNDDGQVNGWVARRRHRRYSKHLDDTELLDKLGHVFLDFDPDRRRDVIRNAAYLVLGRAVRSGVTVAYPNAYVIDAILAEPFVYQKRAHDLEGTWRR
jgi:hypothetical protein